MEEEIKKCEKCGNPSNKPVKIGNCFYTGIIEHHKIPRHKGGRDTKENRMWLCEKCHRKMHTKNGKLNYILYPQLKYGDTKYNTNAERAL